MINPRTSLIRPITYEEVKIFLRQLFLAFLRHTHHPVPAEANYYFPAAPASRLTPSQKPTSAIQRQKKKNGVAGERTGAAAKLGERGALKVGRFADHGPTRPEVRIKRFSQSPGSGRIRSRYLKIFAGRFGSADPTRPDPTREVWPDPQKALENFTNMHLHIKHWIHLLHNTT